MQTAKIAVLVADGFEAGDVDAIRTAVTAAGGVIKIIAPHGGVVRDSKKSETPVDFSLPTVASVLFDAVYIPGGDASAKTLMALPRAIEFVEEAFKHCKAIAASGAGVTFLEKTRIGAVIDDEDSAVMADADIPAKKTAGVFIEAIRQHRNWKREAKTLPTG